MSIITKQIIIILFTIGMLFFMGFMLIISIKPYQINLI